MNKIYFLIILCLGYNVNAQIISFTDANFKAKLLQADVTNEIAMNDFGDNIKIDLNNNSEIEVSEALNVYRLNISNANIITLAGIENFTNLNIIDCSYNQLTNLDLTFRPYMIAINCSHNLITEVNFPPVIDEGVVISYNLIESLELSSNGLTFFQLDCRNNPNLENVFIKDASIETVYSPDYFSTMYWANCPNLSYICAKGSDLPHIQTALNTNGNVDCIINSSCDGGDLVIDFPDGNLKTRLLQADVTNTIANYNKIDSNNNGEIELSEITDIMYLDVSDAAITDLTGIDYFKLMIFDCADNEISSLDQLNQRYLEQLDCSHNQLTQLTITSNSLTDLNCSDNSIGSIDLSMLGFTDYIDIHNNSISTFLPPDYIVYLDIRNNNFNGFPIPSFAMEAFLIFGGNPSDQLIYSGSWRAPKELIYSSPVASSVDLSNVPLSSYEMYDQQPNFYFVNCTSLQSINLKNNLVSVQDYGGALNIANCNSLSSICADGGEEAYFNQRLTELNLNNQVVVSTECQLANPGFEMENAIVLFPNPVENVLNIEVHNAQIQSLSVYNILGQSVLIVPNAREVDSIDVSELTSGTYFIKVVSDKGTTNSKFIKK